MELLIVIVIIAILAALLIPSYTNYLAKSRVNAALIALEEFKIRTVQTIATSGFPSTPNAILFADSTSTSTANPNSVTVTYSNVSSVYAKITSGNAVLLGAALNTIGPITSTNNYVYIAYVNNAPNGANFTNYQWVCGLSASQTNNVAANLLPTSCSSANVP